jgi:hypothetical protein
MESHLRSGLFLLASVAISDFGYNVLRVLDDEEGYTSIEKVAHILSEEEGRAISAGRVRPYLEHALGEYVKKRPSDRWNIASPHHGKFSHKKRPDSGGKSEGSDSNHGDIQEGDIQEHEDAHEGDHDELGRAILRILANANAPLSSRRIAEKVEHSDGVSSSEVEFIKTQVNRRLYYELSSAVEKDDDHLWRLAGREYSETVEPDPSAEPDQEPDSNLLERDRAKQDQNTEQDVSENDQPGASGDGDQDTEAGNQGPSTQDSSLESEGAAQETENGLGMSLSSFEESILNALDEAEGYAFTEAITEVLQQEHSRDVERGRVQFYLENSLNEYVVRKSSKGWRVASSYRGDFSSSEKSTAEGEKSVTKEAGDSEDHDGLDELGQLVLQKLSEASSSLKVRHIASRILGGEHDVSFGGRRGSLKADIKQRLRGRLSTRVETDDEGWWRLSKNVGEESSTPDSGGSEEGVEENSTTTDDSFDAEEELDSTSKEENKKDETEKTTPAGVAAEVSEKLEMAKQIAFLLDLARTPLSISSLTSLLKARGREVTEEDVKQRLESTLARFAAEEKGKYRLKEDFDGPVEAATGGDSPVEKTEEEDTEQKPVDAATRASVSGRRYEYVFESQEMENASLFTSQLRGGTVKIKLNASHAAFDRFEHALEGEVESTTDRTENQYRRLIRLLIVAWIEVEGDLSGRRSELAEEIRDDWGRALRFLLRERDEG